MDESRIFYIDIIWYTAPGVKGNHYFITKGEEKKESTFSEVWQILTNPDVEKLNIDARYNEAHYKLYD